ncbi:MAG: hypothetical protein OEY51_08945 [Cyclobacteriaceae bacterium]|nr:hypothetical protein [Cyclobacteriaceae bacterium]
MLVKKKFSLKPIVGLQGRFATEGNDQFIRLSWDPVPEDSLFLGYLIYANYPPDTSLAREAHLPLLKENAFRYQVSYYYAQTYRFSVSALYRTGNESVRSDVLEITVPSLYLPKVNITNVNYIGEQVDIRWIYGQNIPDLTGFMVYINGQPLLNNPLPATRRSLLISMSDLPASRTTLSITAVTRQGLESAPSPVIVKKE